MKYPQHILQSVRLDGSKIRGALRRVLLAEDPDRVTIRLRGSNFEIETPAQEAPEYVGQDW